MVWVVMVSRPGFSKMGARMASLPWGGVRIPEKFLGGWVLFLGGGSLPNGGVCTTDGITPH